MNAEHIALEWATWRQAADRGANAEASWEDQTVAETGAADTGLRKASSCPCLSISSGGDETQSSLVAQAWPFVDTEKLSAELGGPFEVGAIATQADIVPHQETSA